jgi:hypothetical protein
MQTACTQNQRNFLLVHRWSGCSSNGFHNSLIDFIQAWCACTRLSLSTIRFRFTCVKSSTTLWRTSYAGYDEVWFPKTLRDVICFGRQAKAKLSLRSKIGRSRIYHSESAKNKVLLWRWSFKLWHFEDPNYKVWSFKVLNLETFVPSKYGHSCGMCMKLDTGPIRFNFSTIFLLIWIKKQSKLNVQK